MSCKIRLKKINAVPVIKISGELDNAGINSLSKKFESLLKSSHPKIVVDLNETTYIDSHGLGVLIFYWKELGAKNQELLFITPQGFIRTILDGTNISQIIKFIDTVEGL